MSSFFSVQTKVCRIEPGHSVVCRKLSYGELADCTSASTSLDGRTGEVKIDFARLRKEKMVRSVVSWDGVKFEGREVNRVNILALPGEVAEKINVTVDELNVEIAPEEGNESAAPTND